jgi:hypothetical protein
MNRMILTVTLVTLLAGCATSELTKLASSTLNTSTLSGPCQTSPSRLSRGTAQSSTEGSSAG